MAARAVAVIGPGALGLLYASRLSRVVPTALIARNAERAAELRRGVRVGGRLYKPDAFGPNDVPQADWVIVLVKTHQTAAAIKVAARMNPQGVLSLQNGLIDAIPQGVTTAGAYRDGSKIVPVALGMTLIPSGFAPLAAYLRRAGFPVKVIGKIDAARLQKLLANVCIHPVTALFRIRNGEIRKRPYRILAEALAREAAPVLSAAGFRITPDQAVERVMEVAKITARNRSSMLQDLLAGRKTEREQLTGALLRLARPHRASVPTHRAIYEVIRVMESS